MRTKHLLIAAVVLIGIGAAGILLTSRFGNFRGDRGGFFPGGGMMPMMRDGGMMGGGGMMGRGQMREMMKGMMGNMLPQGIKPEDLPDPGSRGAGLVARFCGQCHDIPGPALHTAQEWPVVANRMFARLSMMSGMPMMRRMGMESPLPDQREAIVGYLAAHAMKLVGPGGLPQPGSAAAVSFKTACSQCHPLPDPKLHTAREWPRVVDRMRAHMREMGERAVTNAEKDEIAAYLSRNARK